MVFGEILFYYFHPVSFKNLSSPFERNSPNCRKQKQHFILLWVFQENGICCNLLLFSCSKFQKHAISYERNSSSCRKAKNKKRNDVLLYSEKTLFVELPNYNLIYASVHNMYDYLDEFGKVNCSF